jgi:hypothetical protein
MRLDPGGFLGFVQPLSRGAYFLKHLSCRIFNLFVLRHRDTVLLQQSVIILVPLVAMLTATTVAPSYILY